MCLAQPSRLLDKPDIRRLELKTRLGSPYRPSKVRPQKGTYIVRQEVSAIGTVVDRQKTTRLKSPETVLTYTALLVSGLRKRPSVTPTVVPRDPPRQQ